MKVKLIIYDLDGVLVEAKNIHYDALNEALGEKYSISWQEHLSTYDGFKSTDFGNGGHKYSFKPSEFNKLIDLYQPVDYSIESPILFDASGYKCPIWRQPLNNTLSMYYSIYKSFGLVDNIKKYDYINNINFEIFDSNSNGIIR